MCILFFVHGHFLTFRFQCFHLISFFCQIIHDDWCDNIKNAMHGQITAAYCWMVFLCFHTLTNNNLLLIFVFASAKKNTKEHSVNMMMSWKIYTYIFRRTFFLQWNAITTCNLQVLFTYKSSQIHQWSSLNAKKTLWIFLISFYLGISFWKSFKCSVFHSPLEKWKH